MIYKKHRYNSFLKKFQLKTSILWNTRKAYLGAWFYFGQIVKSKVNLHKIFRGMYRKTVYFSFCANEHFMGTGAH